MAILRSTSSRLRKCLLEDRLRHLHSLQQAVAQGSLKGPKALYQALRRAFPGTQSKRKSQFQPLPTVRLPDGNLAMDHNSKQMAWVQHFSEMEGGRLVGEEAFLSQASQLLALRQEDPPAFDIAAMPTLLDVEAIFHKLRAGRAPGADTLTATLFRAQISVTASQWFPLYLKTTLAVKEPLSFRGGVLFTLAKKVTSTHNLADFRSILLNNVAAKVQHRLTRQKLLPFFCGFQAGLQAGVQPGVGIDTVALYVQELLHLAEAQRSCWAVIFFDVKSAFYRVVRESLVSASCDESAYLSLLHQLGVKDTDLREFAEALRHIAALPAAGVSPYLESVTQDMLSATWFRLATHPQLVVTAKGTRPGDSAADLLFAFALAAYFRCAEQTLQGLGLHAFHPEPPRLPYLSDDGISAADGFPSWADDFARVVVAPTPEDLLSTVSHTISVGHTHASACGMELTYASDKTAALLCRRVQQHLQLTDSPMIINFVGDRDGRVLQLPIVAAYKHLGYIANASLDPTLDVHHKRAPALGLLRQFRHKLFANSCIPLPLRRQFLKSLALSRFMSGLGIVRLLKPTHCKCWNAAYLAVLRGLFRKAASAPYFPHSYEVLLAANALPPPLQLAQARFQLLRRLIVNGPFLVLHALQSS